MNAALASEAIPVKDKPNHLATLDGLRGVAALAVVYLHSAQALNLQIRAHIGLAVDFFFVLSGFVIAKAYEDKLRRSMSLRQFVTLRLIRLYPMILMGVFLGTCVLALRFLAKDPYTFQQVAVVFASGLLLFPTTVLGQDDLYPADSPCWSLFFELFINFVYAFVARWLNMRRLILACAVAGVALCFAARANHGLDVGYLPGNFWFGFVRVTCPFAMGILLFRCRRLEPVKGGIGILLALLLIAVLFTPQCQGSWVYDCIAVLVVFPLIVFYGAGFTGNAVLRTVCLGLGELSYPLYVTHYPILRVILNAVKLLHWQLAPSVVILLSIPTSVAVAILLLRVWDRPVRARLAMKLTVRRKTAMPLSTADVTRRAVRQPGV